MICFDHLKLRQILRERQVDRFLFVEFLHLEGRGPFPACRQAGATWFPASVTVWTVTVRY